MRRRRAMQFGGAVIAGVSAGCIGGVGEYETYEFAQEAPTDGERATPWPTLAHDARRSGFAPHGRLPLNVEAKQFSTARLHSALQPAFVEETAYFGADRFDQETTTWRSGVVAADHRDRGWFVDQPTPAASPTAVGNALFVTADGVTQSFDRRDGTRCWSYEEGRGLPTAAPTVVGDRLYLTGRKLFALTARTGEVQWATDRPDTVLRGTAATARAVYVTGGNRGPGTVRRYDPENGALRWETATESAILVPPVVGERIYVVESDGWLCALHPRTGDEEWSVALNGRSSAMPVVGPDAVYAVATAGETLYALDAATGEQLWDFSFDASWAVTPTLTESALFFPTGGDGDGSIYVLNPATGGLRRTVHLPQDPVYPLVLGRGVGLIPTVSRSADTELYVLTEVDG